MGVCTLVEAVERLQSATSAGCCWFQGPGELHWKLRRANSELEIEILEFKGGFRQHWRESECIFKARGECLKFARQLLSSLESIKVSLELMVTSEPGDDHSRQECKKDCAQLLRGLSKFLQIQVNAL
jgi:hypothetical protein